MGVENKNKLNQLWNLHKPGIVLLTSWLNKHGFSSSLLQEYRSGGWLTSIGQGAMKRAEDALTIEGALYSLQQQTGTSIHIGGKSALNLLGKSHYLEFKTAQIVLFGSPNEHLPKWFKDYKWDVQASYHRSSFLPEKLGTTDITFSNFTLVISDATRAILECLYLVPKEQDLFECFEIMEGLNNLRPNKVQALLESCNSIKVKRLFLYLANKCNHNWLEYIDLDKIDLGKGKRTIVKGGVYIPQYKITVDKKLEQQNDQYL